MTLGLKEKFLTQYNLTTSEIIDKVYRKPFPNRFLAQFTPFLLENLGDPYIHSMVMSSFISFLRKNVMQYYNYEKLPIHFVGSVAYHFQNPLRDALMIMDMKPGKIIQSPMEGLIKFHSVAGIIL